MAKSLLVSLTLTGLMLLIELDLGGTSTPRSVPSIIPKSWERITRRKIIGGDNADPNKYPWMVRIDKTGGSHKSWKFTCGGSLLAPKFVITAKHCVRSISTSHVRVILADHDRTQTDTGEYVRNVSRIHKHPTSDVDLAILELSSPAVLSTKVKVIPYIAAEPGVGIHVTVIGWGRTASSSPGSLANILQELDIPVAADSQCNSEFSPNVRPTEFCGGANTANYTNVCHGDSGGPVMVQLQNSQLGDYLLVGVVARGTPNCPSTANYAAFQGFRTHGTWIESITGVSGVCFPGDALVTLSSGDKKRMDEVVPGDNVLAMTLEGSLVYSEVIMMMHADRYSLTEYLTIQTEKASVSLRISDKHMMYVQRKGDQLSSFKFAESVKVGDYVFVTDNADTTDFESHSLTKLTVANVTRSYHTGAFAPLTLEGTVVVDGVVASSYAYLESQSLCHMALWPVRLLHAWAPHLLAGDKPLISGQVHWAPALLQSAASPLIF